MNEKFNELDIDNNDLYSNGMKCNSKLDCLINVLCHEIIHVIQFVYCGYGGSNSANGHDEYFMTLANNMFGFSEYFHYFWDG